MKNAAIRTEFKTLLAAALLAPALLLAQGGATGDPTAPSGANVSSTDQRFAEKAARSGLAEVQLGQLATQKASSQQVKTLGEQMVRDHSTANNELQRIAATKGISLPQEPSEEHRDKISDLQEKSGAEFDREYTDLMVKEHQKDIDAFERQSEQGTDPQLRAFADKTLPVLRAHRQHAESTRSALETASSTSSDMR